MAKSKSKKKKSGNAKGGKIQVHGHDAGLVAEAEQVIADGGWGWEPTDMGFEPDNASEGVKQRSIQLSKRKASSASTTSSSSNPSKTSSSKSEKKKK